MSESQETRLEVDAGTIDVMGVPIKAPMWITNPSAEDEDEALDISYKPILDAVLSGRMENIED